MILNDGEPFVSRDLVIHLQHMYNLDTLLTTKRDSFFTNDEHIGYMKGVNEVLNYLLALSVRKEGDDM